MKNLFPANVSVITLIIIAVLKDKVMIRYKRKLANSKVDLATLPQKDGQPVIGPCMYREMTLAEIISACSIRGEGVKATAQRVKAAFPLLCLVALSDKPAYQPEMLTLKHALLAEGGVADAA